MEITSPHPAVSPQPAIHNGNGRITLGYVLLTIVASAAIYFAAAQPGITQRELATAMALP
jgi:hypothetical protein